jgi:hypothetical protein
MHLIVTASRFLLLDGKDGLVDYRYHTGVARHMFCGVCGIKSFYVPRSHPDSFSVNLNCVDLVDGIEFSIKDFDGRNWSENRSQLTES